MNDSNRLWDTILSGLTPIHWDGHKFIAIGAIATLLLFWLWEPLGWIGVLLTAYVAYFFRDPERATPIRDDLVIAPADGRIVSVRLKSPPAELGLPPAPMTCISIFLSVLDCISTARRFRARSCAASMCRGCFSTPRWTRRAKTMSARPWCSRPPAAARSAWCASPG